MRPGEPDQPDGSEELEVDVLLPLGIGDGLERMGVGSAGIVHQDVDMAERLRDPGKSCRDVLGAPHVAGDREDLLPRPRPDRCDGLFQRALPSRHDGDIGAGLRKGVGNRQTEAFAATGDKGFPPRKLDVHLCFDPSPSHRPSPRTRGDDL